MQEHQLAKETLTMSEVQIEVHEMAKESMENQSEFADSDDESSASVDYTKHEFAGI